MTHFPYKTQTNLESESYSSGLNFRTRRHRVELIPMGFRCFAHPFQISTAIKL
ncbi:hypothetical protein LBWT_Y0080 (plasmid) [Leptolyngbya boryana IAM M-101]|nr:hypothetical protein LBWT_Y0080 [Leptolyngbya boryana IAM M-101]BAS66768.1 hypothetical protein LBDG_Y0080 [Leptolyngbya boryana dg5]